MAVQQQKPAQARFDRRKLATVGYMLIGFAALAIGIWLSVSHILSNTRFPTLPFGCFVAAFCAFLLAGKGIVKAFGACFTP